MLCCVAAIAVLAAVGRLLRAPRQWIRGESGGRLDAEMPPPAHYEVPGGAR
ncbi:hypothetical protein GCM10009710_31770 [Aeromicrobium alkaliterrae]|uniref:Uncharacterized protein n=1 Tax=Aeromicrobium alkaliterrae TaxID=302168 RepID=A0ABP4W8R9_9ACTN